jgi:hypothetical protein
VICESAICAPDQISIEPGRWNTGLVADCEQDRLPPGVECKSHTPDPALGIEPELFHVRVSGALEGIHSRSTELGSELSKQARVRQQLVLNRLAKITKFRHELDCQSNCPSHGICPQSNMPSTSLS